MCISNTNLIQILKKIRHKLYLYLICFYETNTNHMLARCKYERVNKREDTEAWRKLLVSRISGFNLFHLSLSLSQPTKQKKYTNQTKVKYKYKPSENTNWGQLYSWMWDAVSAVEKIWITYMRREIRVSKLQLIAPPLSPLIFPGRELKHNPTKGRPRAVLCCVSIITPNGLKHPFQPRKVLLKCPLSDRGVKRMHLL